MKRVYSIVLNPFTNDSRVLKTAVSLRKAGYDARVIAIYEEGLAQEEIIEGVPVRRVKLRTKSWSKHPLVQIIKYFEFLVRAVYACREGDILHCNDLNALPVGAISKLLRRKQKVVYDAHEYEINASPGEGKMRIRLKYLLEKALIRYADRVVTVSRSIAEAYGKMYGISEPALVLNTPFYLETPPRNDYFRRRFGIQKDCKLFLYQGALSRGRGIERLVEAFKALGETAAIVFMGYGPLEGYLQEAARTYRNVFLHEAVAPEKVLEYTSSADFGISLIEDVCMSYRFCLPNKMFEYLMAELPVIVSDLPEMRRVVEENAVGVVAKDNSPEGLKEAVEKIIETDREIWIKNIRKVKKTYNWEAQERVLFDVYEGL
jgi:glycosyltransferase involved in cell wall biosynthesis